MQRYIIIYDLKEPNKNYGHMEKAIAKCDNSSKLEIECVGNTSYIISSELKTEEDVCNNIKKYLEENYSKDSRKVHFEDIVKELFIAELNLNNKYYCKM